MSIASAPDISIDGPSTKRPAASSQSPASQTDPARTTTRSRITHACDRCRLMRTKCVGGNPCDKCRKDRALCAFGDRKRERKKNKKNNKQLFFVFCKFLKAKANLLVQTLRTVAANPNLDSHESSRIREV